MVSTAFEMRECQGFVSEHTGMDSLLPTAEKMGLNSHGPLPSPRGLCVFLAEDHPVHRALCLGAPGMFLTSAILHW